jgi:vacuolar iron transporter family protein
MYRLIQTYVSPRRWHIMEEISSTKVKRLAHASVYSPGHSGEYADADYHTRVDAHRRASGLANIILGGQDGLVNVLGVILGVAVATSNARIVLVAGLAATVAESISMGAVAYTSTLAEASFYASEREREYRHIARVPELERREIYEIYQNKGFSDEMLDQVVETITSDRDTWVQVMMAEEHRLSPINRRHALSAALVVGLSATVGSLIPLAPFMLLSVRTSIFVSILISALTLFAVGFYKARVTVGHPGKSGLEMAIIGTVSALAGYLVGMLLKVPEA